MNTTMTRFGLIAVAASALTACGGSGGGTSGSGTGPGSNPSQSSSYAVGGTVTGLNGAVQLLLNGGSALSVAADGSFVFTGTVASGSAYKVTVATPPSSETCSVSNGTGTVGSANVNTVTVACSVPFNSLPQTTTYASTSFASDFFNKLNAVRQAIGVGVLAQNASLDTAAQAHANYLFANFNPATMTGNDPSTGQAYFHSEDAGLPDFYGALPWDRDSKAGYTVKVYGEVVGPTAGSIGTYGGAEEAGDEAARAMLNSVYHRQTMLADAFRNIGIGVNLTTNSAGNGFYTVDFGGVQNPQALAANTVVVYPASGATDAIPYFSNASEAPSPLASQGALDLGGPVSVQVPTGDSLTVSSFTLTDAKGNAVPVSLVDAQTDKTGEMLGNFAFILPNAPLAPGATYTAGFSGMDGNTQISKTWSFTTLGTINVVTQGPYVVHPGSTLLIQSVVPSTLISWTASSTLTNSQYTITPQGTEDLVVAIANVPVSSNQTIQLTVKDNKLPAVPAVAITITVEP